MKPRRKNNIEKDPTNKFTLVSDKLYKSLCKAIQILLKDSIAYAYVTEQEIEAAREFAALRPDSKVAREFLEFLDREEARETLKPQYPESKTDS